jgi:phosphoglycerate dehydrogenase-like enzyme
MIYPFQQGVWHRTGILDKRDLYILRGFPNVIVTPHIAFYTDQAISNMVKHSLESCLFLDQGKPNLWNVL